ncbi:helix-turn-helix domain-containing protein [Streptomyces sp. 4N509B]|uniref:helix-turn-helix domain-containing protein n=1 Tax=Streptomyces sp. 4N509B TaxID=3457413 RepID=UPI003FD19057
MSEDHQRDGGVSALRPEGADSAAEFVALLRRLKDHTGLSYRQLEERAESRGDVLARSTAADMLRRTALPRREVVAAFVRACGVGEDEARGWLAARDRLAARPADGPPADPHADPTAGDGTTDGDGGVRRGGSDRARLDTGWLGATAVVLVVLLAVGVWVSWPEGGGSALATSAPPFDDGWYEIRTVSTPELCLTEGRDRSGRYEGALAVQRPCGEPPSPRTFLREAGDGLYFIEWHHPREGRGCLTVLAGGHITDMLEPWDECSADRPSQRFLIEPTETPLGGDSYRVRPEVSGKCLAPMNGETMSGVEIHQTECVEDDPSQAFLIAPVER